MSEEQVQESTQETPEATTETTAAPETSTEAPADVNVDQKFTIDGKTFTAEQIAAQMREAENLREYQAAASKLMRNQEESLSPERESDLRYVMAYEGYQPEQIEEYVSGLKGQQQMDPNPQLQPEPQQDPRVDEMNQRLAEVESRERQLRLEALQGKLGNAVSEAANNESLTSIGNAFKRIHGDEGHDKRMEVIKEDVQKEILSSLRRVKSAGGSIDDSTFKSASENAAKVVADRYRTVIGDPDKLGRAPETASGQDMFFKKKPIEIPQFKPGKDTTASVYEKAKTFAEDTLLDIAADISTGGNTKL